MKYKGQKINPLHVIAVRLICWPLLQLFRCCLFSVIAIGWGLYDAQRIWKETA